MSALKRNEKVLAGVYERAINRIHIDNPTVPALPYETIAGILILLGLGKKGSPEQNPTITAPMFTSERSPALRPPRNGTCPLITLPAELRHSIFASSLLDRDAVISPRCDDVDNHNETSNRKAPPVFNRTSDLMVLNKKICSEIATVVYEERVFVIHVHEGIKHGGIEFLNVGRQPLQYKDDVGDRRFEKFVHGESFGFDRLKKLRIEVYPSAGDNRLVSMNTYFMNLALVELLERSEGDDPAKKNRISSLTICITPMMPVDRAQVGRRVILNTESYWWDGVRNLPRETSIHGTSNVELVLLPFSRLRCHNVAIELPERLKQHTGTTDFVDRLINTMTGNSPNDMMDDQFLHLLAAGREAYDEHVLKTLYGNKQYYHVPKLSEADMQYDEQDGGKHDLSPRGKAGGGDKKRRKSDDEDDDSQWMLSSDEDAGAMGDDESRELQQALLESVKTARLHRTQQRDRQRVPGSFAGHGRALGGSPAGARSMRGSPMTSGLIRRPLGRVAAASYIGTLTDGGDDAEEEGDTDGVAALQTYLDTFVDGVDDAKDKVDKKGEEGEG